MYKLVVWQSMLPLFPWRYHFLPCVLGRKWLEPFLGVRPCCVCIREGHGGSTEQSQVMSGVRQDESMVWRPCQKAPPVVRLGFYPSATEALGTGRLETLSQPSCVLLLSACALQPPSSRWLPRRVADLQPDEGLGQLVGNFGWRTPRTSPDLLSRTGGRCQTLTREGRHFSWSSVLWPFIQKEGFRFLQPEAEDSLWRGFVTHVASSSGCFCLLRVGLPSVSYFNDKTNSTCTASSGRFEALVFWTVLPLRGQQAGCRIRMMRAVIFSLEAALKLGYFPVILNKKGQMTLPWQVHGKSLELGITKISILGNWILESPGEHAREFQEAMQSLLDIRSVILAYNRDGKLQAVSSQCHSCFTILTPYIQRLLHQNPVSWATEVIWASQPHFSNESWIPSWPVSQRMAGHICDQKIIVELLTFPGSRGLVQEMHIVGWVSGDVS